jgi:hypothetical protein
MGNNNSSSQEKKQQTVDVSKQNDISDNIYTTADKLYNKIYDDNNKIDTYSDPSRGINMPYITDENAYISRNHGDLLINSENPQYIEFIIYNKKNLCNINDLNEKKEKYAVHNSAPDHDCKGNCSCILQSYEIIGKHNKNSNKYNQYSDLSVSPTSDELYTPTQKKNYQTFNATTSTDMYTPKISNLSATSTYDVNNNNSKVYKSMFGGANKNNDDTSPEDITDSDEDNEEFSDTSEMSDTTTSPAFGDKIKKKLSNNSNENDEDLVDENDTDDEDLEGLDDEDVTENGYILENSEIDTDDLYEMNTRIFSSETDSDNQYNDDDDDDDDITENVRAALNSRKNNIRNKNMFNSEDNKILQMNSETDQYMKRPVTKNIKYA